MKGLVSVIVVRVLTFLLLQIANGHRTCGGCLISKQLECRWTGGGKELSAAEQCANHAGEGIPAGEKVFS